MDLEILPLEERIEPNPAGGFQRYKLARFLVNGRPHTLRISMPDFNAGRTTAMVQAEAQKMDITGTSKGKK